MRCHWKITVRRETEFSDWITFCHDHGVTIYSGSWDDAYLAAAGHAVMEHPRRAVA